MIQRTALPLLTALLIGNSFALAEPLAVVVDAHAGIERMSHDEVINIFLGRYRRLPNGIGATPIDQPEDGNLKNLFYRRLVNKSPSEINAYWARLIFSGKTAPPTQSSSATEVTKLLINSTGGITYMDRSKVDGRFHIVLELN
jgi:hypothetical protein